MAGNNPFPDSDQKAYLRNLHLDRLTAYGAQRKKMLAYLGLPSAEMLDVKVWKSVLSHITAIERDRDVASTLLRTAIRIGVRQRTELFEMPLVDAIRLLAADEDANRAFTDLPPHEQNKVQRVRKIAHDVINIDMCGGFLYPRQERRNSENATMLGYLMKLQVRHRQPFVLIVTFELRDDGGDDYDNFIMETLDALKPSANVADVEQFYLAKQIKGQPRLLRRLRFCLPAYLLEIGFKDYRITALEGWFYKNFYHASLLFEPRLITSALGKLTWPPVEEFKTLLQAPMSHITVGDSSDIELVVLPAPPLL